MITLFSVSCFWLMSLLPPEDEKSHLGKTLPQDIPYLTTDRPAHRGKILALVTSCDRIGPGNKSTGYELTELARAYYVFQANGFEVDVASPKGGEPPVVIDWDDMGAFDFAFLNDTMAQHKVFHSLPVAHINTGEYEAIYLVGGKGAVVDFPDNEHVQSIVREMYSSGRVVGAVCHGPAALVNVKLENGGALLKNKKVCGFTNKEELLLTPDAAETFPFLLQDKLVEKGAHFFEGYMYLENVVRDDNLVTGQNPWSTWRTAESMIEAMGYTPQRREKTAEENTVEILAAYEKQGYKEAKNLIAASPVQPFDRMLLAMHGMVAAWQWEIGKTFDLIALLASAKHTQATHQNK